MSRCRRRLAKTAADLAGLTCVSCKFLTKVPDVPEVDGRSRTNVANAWPSRDPGGKKPYTFLESHPGRTRQRRTFSSMLLGKVMKAAAKPTDTWEEIFIVACTLPFSCAACPIGMSSDKRNRRLLGLFTRQRFLLHRSSTPFKVSTVLSPKYRQQHLNACMMH